MYELDREKVIKGLEEAIRTIETHVPERYRGYSRLACHDAIALLREQEAVRPETIVRTGMREEPTIHALVCGNCHKIMGYCVVYNFCPWCGRAVKWDDP